MELNTDFGNTCTLETSGVSVWLNHYVNTLSPEDELYVGQYYLNTGYLVDPIESYRVSYSFSLIPETNSIQLNTSIQSITLSQN